MNKRALNMQNEMLVKQVASLSSQIEGYKKRMEEYSLLLAARDVEINRLNGELQQAQSGQIEPQKPADETPTPQEEPVKEPENILIEEQPELPDDLPAQPQETAPVSAQSVADYYYNPVTSSDTYTKLDADNLLDNRQKLAAETIAAVTLKAAALDAFLQKSNDPNAKELQAMALGKTEIFKSQVFAVVKGGVDGAGFVASLETLKSQMLEYFENIKMQLR